MKIVGAHEARARFSRLLDAARRGESVEITRYGRAVARLVPPPSRRNPDTQAVIDELERRSQSLTLSGQPLRELIAEGRRG